MFLLKKSKVVAFCFRCVIIMFDIEQFGSEQFDIEQMRGVVMEENGLKIGVEIRKLDNTIHRTITYCAKMAGMDEITLMHGWIIRYLHENIGKDVFQKDIEQKFSINRSTVTNIIQLMEKKGFIVRESVDYDARLKKVMLTAKAVETHQKMERLAKEMDEMLITGISAEEMEVFLRVMNKIKENAGKEKFDD